MTAPIFSVGDDPGLEGCVDVTEVVPSARVDLRYRGTDNFMATDVYGGLRRAFLRPEAAERLAAADKALRSQGPFRFIIWDAARPVRAQRVLWSFVEGTPEEKYVADPDGPMGSIHSYGCAVDLGLLRDEQPMDFGTAYDHFGPAAEPVNEMSLLRSGVLNGEQVANRLLLREVMVRAGFLPIGYEWWHFNAFDNATVKDRYSKIL